jgi:hypothetical protein
MIAIMVLITSAVVTLSMLATYRNRADDVTGNSTEASHDAARNT